MACLLSRTAAALSLTPTVPTVSRCMCRGGETKLILVPRTSRGPQWPLLALQLWSSRLHDSIAYLQTESHPKPIKQHTFARQHLACDVKALQTNKYRKGQEDWRGTNRLTEWHVCHAHMNRTCEDYPFRTNTLRESAVVDIPKKNSMSYLGLSMSQ